MTTLSAIANILMKAKSGQYVTMVCDKTSEEIDARVINLGSASYDSIAAEDWYEKWPATAKDYVQDGLVAMWDGIENGGFGIHNENPSTWIDCMRPDFSYKFTKKDTDIWKDDGLVINSTHAVGGANTNWYLYGFFDHSVYPSAGCVEITLEISNVIQAGGEVISWDGSTSGPLVIKTPWNYLRFTGGGNGSYGSDVSSYSIQDYIGSNFIATFSVTLGNNNLYVNGELARTQFEKIFGKSTAHSFIIGNGGQTMKIRSIRIYNQDITAEQIASNYAIDKARFKLS